MRISDWSSDVCSSDLHADQVLARLKATGVHRFGVRINHAVDYPAKLRHARHPVEMLYYQGSWELTETPAIAIVGSREASDDGVKRAARLAKIGKHTSELQSLMRISYAVFCLKKKT